MLPWLISGRAVHICRPQLGMIGRRSVPRPRGLPNLFSLLSFTSFPFFSSPPLTTRSEITSTALYKYAVSRIDVVLKAISDPRSQQFTPSTTRSTETNTKPKMASLSTTNGPTSGQPNGLPNGLPNGQPNDQENENE